MSELTKSQMEELLKIERNIKHSFQNMKPIKPHKHDISSNSTLVNAYKVLDELGDFPKGHHQKQKELEGERYYKERLKKYVSQLSNWVFKKLCVDNNIPFFDHLLYNFYDLQRLFKYKLNEIKVNNCNEEIKDIDEVVKSLGRRKGK